MKILPVQSVSFFANKGVQNLDPWFRLSEIEWLPLEDAGRISYRFGDSLNAMLCSLDSFVWLDVTSVIEELILRLELFGESHFEVEGVVPFEWQMMLLFSNRFEIAPLTFDFADTEDGVVELSQMVPFIPG